MQECEVSKGGKLQCVSDCSCVFCYTEIKGQVTSLPALRERDMYLLRQLHRASYSWECNALPVTTLVYPLKAWKVTWHLENATHTFASPVLPSPASSFTVHWAHLHRFVLFLNWKLLQPGSASLSSERAVTNATSDSAQTQIKVQCKGHLHTRPAGRHQTAPPGSRARGSSWSRAKERCCCCALWRNSMFCPRLHVVLQTWSPSL